MIEKSLFIKKQNGKKLFVNVLENDINAPNVIYIQTPIGSVVELKECYYPLSKYGLNVFAVDLSGIGQSDGEIKDFTINTLHEDIDFCTEYIRGNYNDIIHLFGGTGTGGILAQHYISGDNSIKSFAQYGLVIHKDVSAMPNPLITRMIYPVLPWIKKLAPNMTLKFKPSKYNGKNAEEENKWYEELIQNKPGAMDMNIGLLSTLLDVFFAETSNIKKKPLCPVLVFAPKHDRYFSMSIIEKYYNWLNQPKQIHIIDDAHLSFIWHAEEICKAASEWFKKYSS